MEKLNSLIVALSLTCSLTQVSAAINNFHIDPEVRSSFALSSGESVVINKEQRLTLSQINQQRNEAGRRLVLVLIALPPLENGAVARTPKNTTDPGRVASSVNINGKLFDLWYPGNFGDLEKDGGRAEYTFPTLESSIEEKWLSRYYVVKHGDQPGESENAYEITETIKNSKEKVFLFFGDVLLDQRDASDYDNVDRDKNTQIL